MSNSQDCRWHRCHLRWHAETPDDTSRPAYRRRASAKASAEEGSVQLHFLIRQTRSLSGVGTVDGLELRARPDLAGILSQVDNAIQRLHHQVLEVGDLVHRCN